MAIRSSLPAMGSGEIFLTEGGTETEIMYRHGFELPEFSMLPFPDKLAPLCEYESLVMRGESDLSVADRELIAAYVSGLNACAYCHGAHIVFAKAYGIEVETIEALMEDRDTAPVRGDLKPVLAYVEKLTISPSRMTEADAQAV